MSPSDTERLTKVETEVEAVKDDIREIRSDSKAMRGDVQNLAEIVAKIAGRWTAFIIIFTVLVAPIAVGVTLHLVQKAIP